MDRITDRQETLELTQNSLDKLHAVTEQIRWCRLQFLRIPLAPVVGLSGMAEIFHHEGNLGCNSPIFIHIANGVIVALGLLIFSDKFISLRRDKRLLLKGLVDICHQTDPETLRSQIMHLGIEVPDYRVLQEMS